MTELRPIEAVLHAPEPHWVGDGFRVAGYFAAYEGLVERLSPFLLLDYHAPHVYPPTENLRRGVGPHPHRGFETVTLAFEGSVAHHDSAGNGGVIGPGDVQWMTAGAGILHREYHEAEFARRGGRMHMLQLWVNLPKASKLTAPRYQALTAAQMGRVRLPDDQGEVRVIAGEFQGARGPARTFTPIRMLDASVRAGGKVAFDVPARENALVLVVEGELTLGDTPARTSDLAVFENRGERIELAARTDVRALLLAGEPIDEPVVQYGPFVMNTEGEIRRAIADFQAGRFGRLDD
ncbi:MAG: pirin family protein [Planctomycetes bacterium]|nr:pirin family protein [Planctomycetota bacterium]